MNVSAKKSDMPMPDNQGFNSPSAAAGIASTVAPARIDPNGLAARDETVRLWNAATGKPVGTISGLSDKCQTLTFTPDSKRLYVSNAAARSVSVIDTDAIQLIATVPVGEVPKRINTLVLR